MRQLLLAALLGAAPLAPAEGLPRTLVDSLDGWKPSRHPASWRLDGGILSLQNDPGRQGSFLWTTADYHDFIVEFEFRFDGGTVDSGVFLRNETDQIQLGVSGSLKRDMTGSPYIAGKGYPIEASGIAELLRPADWNSMKIVVVGNGYDVWLNGEHVLRYESATPVKPGPIGLQVHPGNEMRMRYRNVRLAELQ